MVSYFKVRHGRKSVEFFFTPSDGVSLATARRQAEAYHAALLESSTEAMPDVEMTVLRHGVPGLSALRCVGGCELCSARPLSLVDDGS